MADISNEKNVIINATYAKEIRVPVSNALNILNNRVIEIHNNAVERATIVPVFSSLINSMADEVEDARDVGVDYLGNIDPSVVYESLGDAIRATMGYRVSAINGIYTPADGAYTWPDPESALDNQYEGSSTFVFNVSFGQTFSSPPSSVLVNVDSFDSVYDKHIEDYGVPYYDTLDDDPKPVRSMFGHTRVNVQDITTSGFKIFVRTLYDRDAYGETGNTLGYPAPFPKRFYWTAFWSQLA